MPDYNCTSIHFIGVGSAYSGTKISTVIAGINDFHPTSKCFVRFKLILLPLTHLPNPKLALLSYLLKITENY